MHWDKPVELMNHTELVAMVERLLRRERIQRIQPVTDGRQWYTVMWSVMGEDHNENVEDIYLHVRARTKQGAVNKAMSLTRQIITATQIPFRLRRPCAHHFKADLTDTS